MFAPTKSRERLFWIFQIGGWVALMPPFVILSLPAFASTSAAVFNGTVRQMLGFCLTAGLAAIYRRWDWNEFSLWRHGLIALGLSVAATFVDVAIFEGIRRKSGFDDTLVLAESLRLAASIGRVCIYTGWSALYLALRFAFDFRDRELQLAQTQIAAREAELQALRAQLNPHFLFNALNSILAEAEDNPARVKAITLSLSDLLRFSLRQREHFGQLGAELAAIENYLKVERARFEERLDWRIDVSPAARAAIVPTSLLLPLVENAIKYGLQTSPRHLQLTVSAEVRDGAIAAFVENSGRWIEPDPTGRRSTGIGLSNLRRRLALLCGSGAAVDITFPPGCVRVALQLPLVPMVAG
jgi:two-component sensor histidine kinase